MASLQHSGTRCAHPPRLLLLGMAATVMAYPSAPNKGKERAPFGLLRAPSLHTARRDGHDRLANAALEKLAARAFPRTATQA